ncbi:MAG: polysaccharide biosynthesis/export family protein [Candidatus Xenobia bacterium]
MVCLLCLLQAWLSQPVAAQQATPTPASSSLQVSAGRPLLIGDELEISIVSLPTESRTVKIRQDGSFYMPMFGEVSAAGLTIPELRQRLEKKLSKDLRDPSVEVGLKAMAPSQVVILGEVNKPGQYNIEPGCTLTDLIAKAGGTTADANSGAATLVRQGKSTVVSIVPPVPGAEVDTTELESGDVIYIKTAEKASVTGEVIQPGRYSLSTGANTAWRMIMAAGGPKPGAALSRVQLARIGEGNVQTLDLSSGPTAPAASTPLKGGDTLTVPVQRVLVLGGQASKFVNLTGDDTLVDVVARSGAFTGDIDKVTIIRSADLKARRNKMESVDIKKAVTEHQQVAFTPVGDGDVLVVTEHHRGAGAQAAMNFFNILYTATYLFHL